MNWREELFQKWRSPIWAVIGVLILALAFILAGLLFSPAGASEADEPPVTFTDQATLVEAPASRSTAGLDSIRRCWTYTYTSPAVTAFALPNAYTVRKIVDFCSRSGKIISYGWYAQCKRVSGWMAVQRPCEQSRSSFGFYRIRTDTTWHFVAAELGVGFTRHPSLELFLYHDGRVQGTFYYS